MLSYTLIEAGSKMVDLKKVLAPGFWEAFKVPAYSFAVLTLFLLMRNVNSGFEYIHVKSIANYAIGTSIISYGHFLFYSTWKNRKKELELPFWVQGIVLACHVLWFFYFLSGKLGK